MTRLLPFLLILICGSALADEDAPAEPAGDESADPADDPSAEPGGDESVGPSGDAPAEPGADESADPSGDAPAEPGGEVSADPSGDRPAEPGGDESADPPTDSARSPVPPPPPAPRPPPRPVSPPAVGYDGGFVLASPDGKFALKINGRVQTRFTFEIPVGDPEGLEAAFSVARARLKLSAKLLGWLDVVLHFDFSKGTFDPKDTYGDARMVEDWLHLRAGQFKRPSSRQHLASSSKLLFADRSITHKHFGNDRDLGLMLHNGAGKSRPLEYALAFVNGTGSTATTSGGVTVDLATGEGTVATKSSNVPDRFRPTLVTRVGMTTGGIDGYNGADLKAGPFGVAVGGGLTTTFGLPDDPSGRVVGTVDWILKVRGFSTNGAGFVRTVQDGESFADQAWDSAGFHMHAGYAIDGKVEPAFRLARIWSADPSHSAFEVGGAIGVYLWKQKVRWATDVVALEHGVGADATTALRVQTQLETSF